MPTSKEIKEEIQLYETFKRVSIAEFFERNRHLLGFDNPKKSLLIAVKELVDNSLDACEEHQILPEIKIKIEKQEENIYKVSVEDNGPGIPYDLVPDIYGSFLFGSKFHRFISSRGKQGIGASAITLYSQLTTREPIEVITKVPNKDKAIKYKIKIDVKTNTPIIIEKKEIEIKKDHGTIVNAIILGQYTRGKQSIDEYIFLTALANPHATIQYLNPDGEKVIYKRIVDTIPKLYETKPHPHGIEIGVFERLLKESKEKTILSFLYKTFSSVSQETASKILKKAKIDENKDPKSLNDEEIIRLYRILQETKLRAIPKKYITTLGYETIKKSLDVMFNPDFSVAITRRPSVYRGIPFIVEVGIAYGGKISEFQLLRFANRVPLLYKAGECAITAAAKEINWKRYGFNAEEGYFPKDPIVVMIHVASVWLPFTSESKEAISPYPEIVNEIELAIKNALREVSLYVKKVKTLSNISNKYLSLFGYGLETAEYLSKILDTDSKEIEKVIIERIKKELKNDILEIIKSMRELKNLIKENKDKEAIKMLENMMKDLYDKDIISKNELYELIKQTIEDIKSKYTKILNE